MDSVCKEGDTQLHPSVAYHHLECFPLPSRFQELSDLCEHLYGWHGLDDKSKSEFSTIISKTCFGEEHSPPRKGLSEMFPPFSEDHMIFEAVLLPRITRGMASTLSTHEKAISEEFSSTRRSEKRKLSSSGVASDASSKRTRMPKSIAKEISES